VHCYLGTIVLLNIATLLLITRTLDATSDITMVRINRDCIDLVLNHLPARDVVNACLLLCTKGEIRDTIRNRLQHRRILQEVVLDPDELLQSMYKHKYIMLSDRISQYFVPGLTKASRSWDIVVSELHRSGCFASLKDMGIEPLDTDGFVDESHGKTVYTMCRSKYATFPQSITITVVKGYALKHVLNYPLTSMCCFIAYFGAVHMYGKLSSMNKMLAFEEAVSRSFYRTMRSERLCVVHTACLYLKKQVYEPIRSTSETDTDPSDECRRLARFVNDSLDTFSETRDAYMHRWEFVAQVYNTFDRTNMNSIESAIMSDMSILNKFIEAYIDVCTCVEDEVDVNINNYTRAGYSMMDFDEYMHSTDGWFCGKGNQFYETSADEIGSGGTYRSRSLGDPECTIIPFHCPGVNNTLAFVSHVKSFSWYEYRDGILPTDAHSLISAITKINNMYISTAPF
jgi:hypothetical protein